MKKKEFSTGILVVGFIALIIGIAFSVSAQEVPVDEPILEEFVLLGSRDLAIKYATSTMPVADQEFSARIEQQIQLLINEQRQTIKERCDKAIELAQNRTSVYWVNRNEESKYISKNDGEAVEIIGSMSIEKKEDILIREMIKKYPTDSPEKIQERVDLTLPQYTSFNSAGNASVSTIANAIKKVESQGNYNAKGASGEFGAYQFMPSTWKQWAGQFLGDPNAQPTPKNQDFVAQSKINELISKGYNPEQIALIWNGGTPTRKAGINKFGVKYDSDAYADKVLRNLT